MTKLCTYKLAAPLDSKNFSISLQFPRNCGSRDISFSWPIFTGEERSVSISKESDKIGKNAISSERIDRRISLLAPILITLPRCKSRIKVKRSDTSRPYLPTKHTVRICKASEVYILKGFHVSEMIDDCVSTLYRGSMVRDRCQRNGKSYSILAQTGSYFTSYSKWYCTVRLCCENRSMIFELWPDMCVYVYCVYRVFK